MTIARPKGVSRETITQAISRGDRGLDLGLWRQLHHQRRRRPGEQKRSVLGQFRSIARRPADSGRRRQIGHLEGHLIIGANNASAVITIVDRVTRFCLLGALPDGYDAASATSCVIRLLRPIPQAGRRTLTWDQGQEMALWADIEHVLGTPIYFADPHAPWQRPVNENLNRLMRRWLAKSTDLSISTQADLDAIARRINHMPRRSLNWGHAHRHSYDALLATTGRTGRLLTSAVPSDHAASCEQQPPVSVTDRLAQRTAACVYIVWCDSIERVSAGRSCGRSQEGRLESVCGDPGGSPAKPGVALDGCLA